MQPSTETPCEYGITDTTDKQVVFSIADYREALQPITDRAWKGRCAFKNRDSKTGWTSRPLDAARVNEHLAGQTGCGVGFITPGESVTRLALFDLDSHKGEVSFADMAAIANRLCARLDDIGARPVVFRSSGGSGIHIWLLWETAQDAHSVRHAMQEVLTAEDLKEGAGGGVACGQVEIFPKQSSVPIDGCGNMVILPLWNKSEVLIDELGLYLELVPAGQDAVIGMPWPMSDPVPFLANTAPARVQGEAAAPDNLDKIARALAVIPNDTGDGTNGATNYDAWRNLVFAVHEGSAGSEDGFNLIDDWTNQNPGNAGQRETRRVWDQCKPGAVTRGTLYAMASKCNSEWDAPTPDGFDDVPTENTNHGAQAVDDTTTSDVANARRLARLMAGEFVYVHGGHGWCKYRTGLFSRCTRGEHMETAKALGGLILREANSLDPEKMKKTMAQATRAMSAAGIAAALSLAQSDPQIAIDPTEMDSDPDLLNTENCIVHLPTGEALPHSPTMIMGRQCHAPYIVNAPRPLFDRFMLEISKNDTEWVDYMQRLVGYTISGRVNEEIIIFLLGWGANGKSVFSNVIRRILNSYSGSVPANFLMVSNRDGEAATPSLAQLPGVRLAQANEVEAGSRLSAQAVKVAASSDAIAARHLHKAAFEFVPTHTLWVRGNHKPIITDTDDGIWRRIRLVPFDQQFGPDEKDVHLEEKLMIEAPGILAWMVQGHQEYLRRGLSPAKRVADASINYRNESDLVAQWISERTDRGDGSQCPQSEAYQDYREWCSEQGLQRPMTKRSFTLSLAERGFVSGQESTGARRRVYVGFQSPMY